MFSIKRTKQFDEWFAALEVGLTQKRLLVRLRKAQLGNLGDVKAVGDGVYEMREHFGGGIRMYYLRRKNVIIVILGGGDKSTQDRDIARAKRVAETLDD
jgi:putative addiction module killer protein